MAQNAFHVAKENPEEAMMKEYVCPVQKVWRPSHLAINIELGRY